MTKVISFDMDVPEDAIVENAICIVTYMDHDGDIAYGFHVGETIAISALCGLLDMVKHHALVSKGIGT